MPSWIQDRKTGKLVPKEEYVRQESQSAYVMGDLESFVSPIDGTVISDRGHLRAHNKRHGVTNMADYGNDWIANRKASLEREQLGQEKKQRVADLQRAFAQNGERR